MGGVTKPLVGYQPKRSTPSPMRSQRDSDVGQATTAAPYACISVFIVSGTEARVKMTHGSPARAAEATRCGAECLGRRAGERYQIVLDGEIHGDALRTTARAAREHSWLLEAGVAAEAEESEDVRLRGHGGR